LTEETVLVPRYEWRCACGLWHTGDLISHGYWYQSDSKERRQLE